MIEQKKKLRLDEIQVQSLITALSQDELLNTLRGGTDDGNYDTLTVGPVGPICSEKKAAAK
jgi:hypothetical protein